MFFILMGLTLFGLPLSAFWVMLVLQVVQMFMIDDMVYCQIKLLSIDEYGSTDEQEANVNRLRLKIFLAWIIFISFISLSRLVMNYFCVVVFLASVWVPQILHNVREGQRNVPTLGYAFY